MSSIVVYSSKTGFVEKYARWIAEELGSDAVQADDISFDDLLKFDKIVFGGGLYAGGINGIKIIRKNLDKFGGKKIAVFASGASPARQETIEEIRERNFSKEEQKMIGFFYLRGGFDYDKLGIKDKMLMKLLKKKLEAKKTLTEDEQGMLSAYEEPVDFTDRNNIKDLVEFMK
jgi:flavodoxin